MDTTAIPTKPVSSSTWLVQARRLVNDLHHANPALYWFDLLLSAGAAWVSVWLYFNAPFASLEHALWWLLAAVLLFRAGAFIHEIVHMPATRMRGFKWTWNLLVGIPLLTPWILYRNHVDHHNAARFGTPADGEYLPLGAAPRRELVKYVAQAPILPLLMLIRFGLLAPLSWLHRGLREWVLTRASAAASNPWYRRRFAPHDEAHLRRVEAACFVWLLLLAGWLTRPGVNATSMIVRAYLLLALALGLNWFRNLVAHRYANRGGRIDMAAQVRDSVNIAKGGPLTSLLFPVGLRWHALHHMLPGLPYHNLGEAHRRLMYLLPDDAPYRQAAHVGFAEALHDLWWRTGAVAANTSAMPVWSGSADHLRRT